MRRAAREARRVICLAMLCAPLVPLRARAAEPPSISESGPSLVRVHVAGPDAAVARVRVTVTELCARLKLSVVVQEAQSDGVLSTPSTDAFAEAFIDLRSGLAPRVVVLQGDTRRELERRTLPPSSSLELSVEEASHVLYMAVESALRAREARSERAGAPGAGSGPDGAAGVGGARADGSATGAADSAGGGSAPAGAGSDTPQRPAPRDERAAGRREGGAGTEGADRARATTRHDAARRGDASGDSGASATRRALRRDMSHFEGEIAAFGSVLAFGPDHLLPGLGASFDAGVRVGAFRWSATLSGGATLAGKITAGAESAELRADVARLLASVEWDASRLVAGFVGVGGGVDRVTVEPFRPPSGVVAVATAPELDAVVEGRAGLKLLLASAGCAFAGVAMDVDLAPHRYVVETAGASEPFFTPPRVRPMPFVGLSFLVSGESRGAAP